MHGKYGSFVWVAGCFYGGVPRHRGPRRRFRMNPRRSTETYLITQPPALTRYLSGPRVPFARSSFQSRYELLTFSSALVKGKRMSSCHHVVIEAPCYRSTARAIARSCPRLKLSNFAITRYARAPTTKTMSLLVHQSYPLVPILLVEIGHATHEFWLLVLSQPTRGRLN